MSIVQIFSIAGKIFTTLFLVLFMVSSVNAKQIVFTFTGTTLKEDLKTYLQWKQYLEENSKLHVDIKFARTYAEVVSSIKDDKSDIAYVCGSTYTILKDKKNAKLLVIPVSNGKDIYYADIIALQDSKFKSLYDFKDKIFAFTDPESTSGAISPTYHILKKGYDINHFFKNLIYTYDHGESIEAVLNGFVDGASIDSLVFTQYAKKHPVEIRKLKVVEKLGPYTISPIVVRQNLDEKTFNTLQELFINMNKTKVGKEILKHLNIDKFEKPSNQTYTQIYEMLDYIKTKK
ncbi:phosphate/phosphite/phosphonate ABC transporter substrate-binding protein [Sulfurospirillum sp. 1307]